MIPKSGRGYLRMSGILHILIPCTQVLPWLTYFMPNLVLNSTENDNLPLFYTRDTDTHTVIVKNVFTLPR